MSPPDAAEQIGDSDWLQHDAVIESFERAWQNGTAPKIEDFAPPAGDPGRRHVLAELVKLDIDYRWHRGEQPAVDQYLSRFSELGKSRDVVLDLNAFESRVRRGHGVESPGSAAPSGGAFGPAGPRTGRIGRYGLREAVGRGGFATVYRAWDTELQRDVAIKLPREEFAGQPELMERELREARSAAQLRHPAIVPIYEVGTHGDATFIVYEFVPGPTLAKLLRETRPSPQQATEWVARIAEALDYAHDCGVIHRDVKPSNIMMDRDGQPMLTDFGLALQSDSDATLTQDGDILGTPAYMSPEQARGEGHKVDARTDVYSLGVVLYELLLRPAAISGQRAERVAQSDPR